MVCASTLRFDFAKTKIALYKKYPLLLLLHVIGPHASDRTPCCSRLHEVLWSWMCSPKPGSQGGDWQIPGTQTAAAVGVGSSAVIRHHVWAIWLGWGHLQHHRPSLSAQASGCEHSQQPHTSLASSIHCFALFNVCVMNCKIAFIKPLHPTWTWSAQYKSNMVNKNMYRTKSTLKSCWLYKSVHNTSFNSFLIASSTCIHRSAHMHAAHTHFHACTHSHGCILPVSAFFSLWNCFYLNDFCCVPVMLSWYNCTFCCCFSLLQAAQS